MTQEVGSPSKCVKDYHIEDELDFWADKKLKSDLLI